MSDKPEGGVQGEKAEVKETGGMPVAALTSGGTSTTAGETQTKNTGKARKYSKYILWPFVAIRWLIKKLDEYDGAVTAMATIVIAYLTWNYATIARKQWGVMDSQLKDVQKVRRPWVGIDGGIQFPEPPRFEIYETNRSIHLNVRYSIKNFGGTPALNVSSYALIFVEKGIPKRPERTMNDACSFADGDRKIERGAVIFPNQPIMAGSDPGTTFDPTMNTVGQIWLAICSTYSDEAGKIYHTKTWLLTQPPKDAQPIIAVPGYPLRYYPVFEAQVFYEETDR